MDLEQQELDFRRRWYEAHLRRFEQDPEVSDWRKVFRQTADGYLAIRNRFADTRDVNAFVSAMQLWSRHEAKIFDGTAGQMLLNQMVNYSSDHKVLAEVLLDVLWPPPRADLPEALRKIEKLVEYVGTIKRGSGPAPGNVPFFLSYQWAVADQDEWPVIWKSAADFAEFLTGEDLPASPSERYRAFLQVVNGLDANYAGFEEVARWWDQEKVVLVDPVLVDRCLLRTRFSGQQLDEEESKWLRINAQVLVGTARHWGKALAGRVEDVLGEVRLNVAPLVWVKDRPRGDVYVDLVAAASEEPGLRIALDWEGLTIGINSGMGRTGWKDQASGIMERWDIEGYEVISSRRAARKTRYTSGLRPDQVMFGRFWVKDELPEDLGPIAVDTAEELASQIKELVAEYRKRGRFPTPDSDSGTTPEKPTHAGTVTSPDLGDLARKLYVDRDFLEEIVDLLSDKRQVIFYGPPGTGKTYLAMKLAEYLAPDDRQRGFVQFHPSMSYEDFFEGYRPHTGEDGAMTYRLTPGPLRNIAEKAAASPDKQHIMIIDEINRANLPKVLGELLFLLEYREEAVLPLYRPSEPFKLPPNLWFIGTMNTADRSIAVMDTALRRRFHFYPFLPDKGLMKGLLERWLRGSKEEQWVARLVSDVNHRLSEALGGPHLQLGHSHFMKPGISDMGKGILKQVWRYTVEPFIEEQFFDDPDQVRSFSWQEVSKPYGSPSQGAEVPDQEKPTESQQDEDGNAEAG